MALANRPLAAGVDSSDRIAEPPADSPNTVTFFGSPPKAAILACTHLSAASWSIRP